MVETSVFQLIATGAAWALKIAGPDVKAAEAQAGADEADTGELSLDDVELECCRVVDIYMDCFVLDDVEPVQSPYLN